jgi:hypothetical protein
VHGGSLTARHQMPSLVGQWAPDASVGPAPRPHRNLAKILGARGSARPIAPGSSPVRRRRGFDSTTCWARARLSAVDVLSTGIVIGIVVVALAATLGASEVLVRGVGRLARNLGLLAGVVGLIVALGADSPEISSSVSAVASGSAATAAGVVFGSNVFNIAFLLGGAALAAGEVRIRRSVVVLDAGVAIVVTLAMGLAVLGEIPIAAAWSLMLLVFIPYITFLFLSPTTIAQLPLPSGIGTFLADASREADV